MNRVGLAFTEETLKHVDLIVLFLDLRFSLFCERCLECLCQQQFPHGLVTVFKQFIRLVGHLCRI